MHLDNPEAGPAGGQVLQPAGRRGGAGQRAALPLPPSLTPMTLPSGPGRQGTPSPSRPLSLATAPQRPLPPMPPSPGGMAKEPKRNRKNSGASYEPYKVPPLAGGLQGVVEGYGDMGTPP